MGEQPSPHQAPGALTGHAPLTGLPEGGSPPHHGHVPTGAALRIPHQQVGWDRAGAGAGDRGSQHRSSPPSSPSLRAPLSTPRLLINKEKTGQVSWLLFEPPSDFLSSSSSQGSHIPFHWDPQLRTRSSRIQIPGHLDSGSTGIWVTWDPSEQGTEPNSKRLKPGLECCASCEGRVGASRNQGLQPSIGRHPFLLSALFLRWPRSLIPGEGWFLEQAKHAMGQALFQAFCFVYLFYYFK